MPPDLQDPASRVLPAQFSERVAQWQSTHGRSALPWQNTRDPYRVWLSEVMLQQTQVTTVLGYYDRFLCSFPTVAALAAASEDEVFGLWSGLGYYSRARNMHKCAQEVMARFHGVFPQSAAALETLPGIGRSTSAAIAAFCFGERVAILDGNVKRVLTRVLGFDGDLSSSAQERALWRIADDLLPPAHEPARIARYTQGLMDLGATVCMPRKPTCLVCPVNDVCMARREGTPERYPVKTRKLRRSAESLWLLHARDSTGRVWLEKRPARGVWAGLYCLPVFADRDALMASIHEADRPSLVEESGFVHVLTHKDLHLHPMKITHAQSTRLAENGDWFDEARWQALGLPSPVRKLMAQG